MATTQTNTIYRKLPTLFTYYLVMPSGFTYLIVKYDIGSDIMHESAGALAAAMAFGIIYGPNFRVRGNFLPASSLSPGSLADPYA